MQVLLESERLVLRRFTEGDAENLFDLDSDPEVMRYLSGGTPTPREVVQNVRACEDLDGCLDTTGNVLGTYIHGLFHSERLRRSILGELAARKGVALRLDAKVLSKEEQYDRLATLVRNNLDMGLIYGLMGLEG